MSDILQALSTGLADAAERTARSVVAVHARRRIPASGVVWRPGVVVATHHTLERDEDITLTLDGGRGVPATVAGRDPSTDIAILKFEGDAPPAERADDAELRVGTLVLGVGRPGSQFNATLGLISTMGGEWRTRHGGRVDRLVRLDMSVYDGFSGGALVTAAGRLLGINTSWLARGAAVTIPAATVDRVVDQLLERGHIPRGFLGLAMQSVRLPDALRQAHQVSGPGGLLVVNVEPGGPGEQAGVLLGDIVLTVGGRPVHEPGDVVPLLGPDSVGTPLPLRLLRAGQPLEVPVTPGESPRRE